MAFGALCRGAPSLAMFTRVIAERGDDGSPTFAATLTPHTVHFLPVSAGGRPR